MPDYTRAQVVAAFRADNPDAKHISDDAIFTAIATEDPELARGVSDWKPLGGAPPEKTMAETGIDVGKRFFSGIGDAVTGMASGLYHAATDPTSENDKIAGAKLPYLPTVAKRLLVDPQIDQLKKAREAYKSGETIEAIGHGLAGVLPVYGPAAAAVGERAGTGDIAGAAGMGLTYAAVPKVAEKVVKTGLPSSETIQGLANKAKEIRDYQPGMRATSAGASIGGIAGYKMGGGPGAAIGATVGAAAPSAIPKVVGGASAAVLERLARARAATEAPAAPYAGRPPVVENSGYEGPAAADTVVAGTDYRTGMDMQSGRVQPIPEEPNMFPQGDPVPDLRRKPYDANARAEYDTQAAIENYGTKPEAPVEAPAAVPEDLLGFEPEAPMMEPAVPPNVQRVADALITRGRGAGGADMAITNAQYLMRIMPEIEGLSAIPDATGISPFDRAITNKLNEVGHQIGSQLETDAHGKVIDTSAARTELEQVAASAAAIGDFTSANKIKKFAATLDDGVEGTPATKIIETRRQLFDSGLDLASQIGKEAYGVFKDLSEQISPGIKELNQKYYTLKTSAELADIRTGGPTPESQVGMGTRPAANFKDRVQAAKDAKKASETGAKKTQSESSAADKAKRLEDVKAAREKAERVKRGQGWRP